MSIELRIAYDYYILYCSSKYRRLYRTTLVPDSYNLERAYRVYRHGVLNRKGIVEAIMDIYGYRYRRMENFLKELRIWIPRKGWTVPHVLTKVTVTYMARKKKRSNIVLEADIVSLFPFMEYLANEPLILNLVLECLENHDIFGIEEVIGEARIDSQFIPRYTTFLMEREIDVEVSFMIEFVRGKSYQYEGTCTFRIKPFILGGVLVRET